MNIYVTDEMVRKEILKLGLNKSPAPDEMHPQIVTELAEHISKSLALFLSKTFIN